MRRRRLILGLLVVCGGVALRQDATTGAAAWRGLAPLAGGPRQETAAVAHGGRA